jgi:type I restriction enzyme, R subunit
MNEAETRAEHIDPALKAAGWGVVEGSRILREYRITEGRIEGHGKRGKAEIADYMLVYRNIKLAVVEAKAWNEALTEGVGQAKSYAGKMRIRHTYSTNGQGIYAIDMAEGIEGEIQTYPSPDELWNIVYAEQNLWRDRFSSVSFPDKSGSWTIRYYQEIAVNRVLDSISTGKDRILLTLATGTGKTSIAFQIAWKLFQARWNLADSRGNNEPTRRPRILFLADRNVLATQAYNDFTSFAAFKDDAFVRVKPDDIRKKGQVPKNASVFFTIFQTFMSGPSSTAVRPELVEGQVQSSVHGSTSSPRTEEKAFYFGEYPPDFFDLIIIDECHRGGANDEGNWRGILEYFSPAVQLGLTATPKRRDNVDTYAYFGEPVYVYSLKEGINDGFLTPFKVKQIATTMDDYVYTPDDELIEGEVETGKRYIEKDFNKIIEIKEREAKRVEVFMDMINQNEKTLVFCATQDHALAVRDLINQLKTSKDPNYCQRVTANDGTLGEQHLRDFQDNEKTIPTILTTSQKLSTGVDARNIRNIVLMRNINSMIEFKQIVGRGTRLYDGKYYFTIYDFVRAHQHFSDPAWDGEPLEPETEDAPYVREPRERTEAKLPAAEYQKPQKIKIKLADGKARTIQHMAVTSFWHSDGTPMSAQQFMQMLFGKLPEFFKDEDELRSLWSAPDTRAKLLQGLSEKGFGKDQMTEMQKIIDAENSDLFDVLAHVAYALAPLSREDRAAKARAEINSRFNNKQQTFLDFVLAQYVKVGVEELDQDKLSPLLKLKYNNAIADAIADLGDADEINKVFSGFQKYLYQRLSATASANMRPR